MRPEFLFAMASTIWGFTLVGMKYRGISAKDAAQYERVALVREPDNAVDSHAVKVLGIEDGEQPRMLGYVSMDSTRPPGDMPEHRTGTVYRVYSSNARSPGAVEVLVHLTGTRTF